MYFFFSFPLPILFLFVVVTCMAIGLGGNWLVHRMGWVVTQNDNEAITLTHALAGVLYAVALGLMVVNVQAGYTEVKLVVMKEANLIEDLFIDAQGLSDNAGEGIQELARAYIDAIIDEWDSIGDLQDSELPSHAYVEDLTRGFLGFEPVTDKDLVIYSEMLTGFNNLLDMRRERLHLGRDGIGSVAWLVVIVGALITIGMTWFHYTESRRLQYGLVGTMCVLFSLMIFLIVTMDHPLLGGFRVDSSPFEQAQQDMHVWQRHFGQ